MSGQVRISAVAVSDSGLLCKMLGYFAQLDLPAPELIPTCTDQNLRAHLRRPMVMMRHG